MTEHYHSYKCLKAYNFYNLDNDVITPEVVVSEGKYIHDSKSNHDHMFSPGDYKYNVIIELSDSVDAKYAYFVACDPQTSELSELISLMFRNGYKLIKARHNIALFECFGENVHQYIETTRAFTRTCLDASECYEIDLRCAGLMLDHYLWKFLEN